MKTSAPATPKPSLSTRPERTDPSVIWDMVIATALIIAAAVTVTIGVLVLEDDNVAIFAAAVAAGALFLRPVFTAFARSNEVSEAAESKLKDIDVVLAVVATMTGAPVVVTKILELL